jgi:drug/metabolite transporter (DMT)-like permease
MSWTAMTPQPERPQALWGRRGDPETPRPSGGFWAVVASVLPVVNVIAAAVALGSSADAFFAAMATLLVAELVALHRWLVRTGVRPARWLAVAGFLIVAETGVVLFLALVAIFAAVGGD